VSLFVFRIGLRDLYSVSFVLDPIGAVLGMTYHQGGMDLELLRDGFEPPNEAILEEVKGLLGRYRFDPANLDVQVMVEHGRLAVDVTGQMIFGLRYDEEQYA